MKELSWTTLIKRLNDLGTLRLPNKLRPGVKGITTKMSSFKPCQAANF